MALDPFTYLCVPIILKRCKACDIPCLEFGEQRHADPAEKPGQAFGAGLSATGLAMLVDELAAHPVEVLLIERNQRRRFRQMRNLAGAHRTVSTALRRPVIAEVLRQPVAQALLAGKQIQHGVNTRYLGGLVVHKVIVQLLAQSLRIEIRRLQAVHLSHLLAFKLDPALLLKEIQRRHYARAFSLILLVHRLEVDRGPGSRAAGSLDQRLHELLTLALELLHQRLRLYQVFEAIFGKVRIARRDDPAQLKLHQQGLERQLANIAQVRKRQQQKLPLPLAASAEQIIEHPANAFALRRVAIHEVLQDVEAVTVGQHQTLRNGTIASRPTDLLAVVFDGFGQVEMHDVADIALVDAHAERDGGDDAVQSTVHDLALNRLALIVRQTP